MSVFDPRTWFKPKAAEVVMAAQPVEINPNPSRQLSRAMARFERVKAAIRKGDKRPALLKERTKLEYLIEVLRK